MIKKLLSHISIAEQSVELTRILTYKDQALHTKLAKTILGMGGQAIATVSSIRDAYKARVLLVHPDKCADSRAGQAFQVLTDAYRFLMADIKNPAKSAAAPAPAAKAAASKKPAKAERANLPDLSRYQHSLKEMFQRILVAVNPTKVEQMMNSITFETFFVPPNGARLEIRLGRQKGGEIRSDMLEKSEALQVVRIFNLLCTVLGGVRGPAMQTKPEIFVSIPGQSSMALSGSIMEYNLEKIASFAEPMGVDLQKKIMALSKFYIMMTTALPQRCTGDEVQMRKFPEFEDGKLIFRYRVTNRSEDAAATADDDAHFQTIMTEFRTQNGFSEGDFLILEKNDDPSQIKCLIDSEKLMGMPATAVDRMLDRVKIDQKIRQSATQIYESLLGLSPFLSIDIDGSDVGVWTAFREMYGDPIDCFLLNLDVFLPDIHQDMITRMEDLYHAHHSKKIDTRKAEFLFNHLFMKHKPVDLIDHIITRYNINLDKELDQTAQTPLKYIVNKINQDYTKFQAVKAFLNISMGDFFSWEIDMIRCLLAKGASPNILRQTNTFVEAPDDPLCVMFVPGPSEEVPFWEELPDEVAALFGSL